MTDFDVTRLPALEEWRSRFVPPLAPHTYLPSHTDVTATLLLADLLVPSFDEDRGCVLVRALHDPESFEQWWDPADPALAESKVNLLVLWDILEPEGEVEEQALADLADRIARSWQLHASARFPDREFTAQVYEGYGPCVTMTSRLRPER